MSRLIRLLAAPALVAAIVLGVAGPVAASEPALAGCPTTEAQNEALVRRWYDDIWTGKNLDLLGTLLSPDHVHHWATGPDTDSAAAVKERIAGWHTVMPDMRYTIDGIHHADGVVVVRWTGAGTFLGAYQGTPPNGRSAEWSGINIFRIECGRFVEIWSEMDAIGMFRQLGLDS
jgi:steroid delta-isomerase-like uncharacterized protein